MEKISKSKKNYMLTGIFMLCLVVMSCISTSSLATVSYSNVTPSNGATNVNIDIGQVYVTITSNWGEGHPCNGTISLYKNNETLIANRVLSSLPSGQKAYLNFSDMLEFNTVYYIRVYTHDNATWLNTTYSFTVVRALSSFSIGWVIKALLLLIPLLICFGLVGSIVSKKQKSKDFLTEMISLLLVICVLIVMCVFIILM